MIHLMNLLDVLYLLSENRCYSNVNENTNEYLVFKQDKDRIINESWIPSEVYIPFKSYFCPNLMSTLAIVHPIHSYFDFLNQLNKMIIRERFFIIIKKLENEISLKRYLRQYSTLQMTNYLIYSILIAITKLENISIIHQIFQRKIYLEFLQIIQITSLFRKGNKLG
jgi:hypothetical protein